MGSQFDELAADASAVVHDHFGDDGTTTVVYTSKSGTETTLDKPIIADRGTREEPDGQNGSRRVHVKELTLKSSDVAAPELSATVTIGSVKWAVREIIAAGENFCVVELTRRASIEKSRNGYRRSG